MEELPCLICTVTTASYLRNFTKLNSEHSKTSVLEFLRVICGDDDFHTAADVNGEDAECEQSIICMECMEKINDYDAACIIKERIEREFRVNLQRSRALHRNVESPKVIEVKIENIEDIEDIVDTAFSYESPSESDGIEMEEDECRPNMASNEYDGNDTRYLWSYRKDRIEIDSIFSF